MKSVAIVGAHPILKNFVPWDRDDLDFWLVNESASQGWPEKVDALFQMHLPPIWRNKENISDPGHYDWLRKTHDFHIYMQDQYDDVPSSVAYPIDEVSIKLLSNIVRGDGQNHVRYFTSSIAYMLAMAIYQERPGIELYGIQMSSDTEYFGQRECVMFWAGVAAGKDIKFCVQETSPLFNGLLYGYDGGVVIERTEFEFAYAKLSEDLSNARDEMSKASGTVEASMRHIDESVTEKDREERSVLYWEALKKFQSSIAKYSAIEGALKQNEFYMRRCDDMIQAAGGSKAVEPMLEHCKKEMQNG